MGRLIAEIQWDLDDLRAAGTMKRAVQLTEQTGEQMAAHVLPMYFTGRYDAEVVLIHLNPKLDPKRVRTTVPDLTVYLDQYARYGHHTWGSDPTYSSAFDHKQVRFLRPFDVIEFAGGTSPGVMRNNAELVIDKKLQLELIPYASQAFRTSRFAPRVLAPHFERVLDVVTDHPRQFVLFCGAVFDELLERSGLLLQREDHRFRLQKSDGTMTRSRYGFSNLVIDHGGTTVHAGLARSFAAQGLPMSDYGRQCSELYDRPRRN